MSAAITIVLIVSAEKSGGASRKPPARQRAGQEAAGNFLYCPNQPDYDK